MKAAIWIAILMRVSTLAFSQETNHQTPIRDKQYYQSKGGQQLAEGSILLGGGIAALAIASGGHTDMDGLPFLVITGVAATLRGICLVISSAKSKKKARSMNAFLKMETAPIARQYALGRQYFPSLTVEIGL